MGHPSLKLAITSIGDLLLNNKITQNEEGKNIDGINLAIPNYQRPYKWKANNVTQLLNDIIGAKKENKEIYRAGTLILHSDESDYNIVDGQQRIITFSLLHKALTTDPADSADQADRISFLNQKLVNNAHNAHNVPNNFLTIQRSINRINDESEKSSLFEYIKNNCELVVVITDDISEAFQFFDSQNARGKKLYPHDLLKAFHLREMSELETTETEKTVKSWEDLDQKALSSMFSDYLYRIKQWIRGERANKLSEKNIHIFKGITRQNNFPFAQFYKGAFAFANTTNSSAMPFVTGIRNFNPFQLNTPIIAGKPFFDYAKHYYNILSDIQNNGKYEGYLINDNEIVKTLDLDKYKYGTGNHITRLLFDSAILLYVDRFRPAERPTKEDLEMLDQFVVFAFIWAYSLRAQYKNLGWLSAQNYIMYNEEKTNSFNIYKVIAENDTADLLLSTLINKLLPLSEIKIKAKTSDIDKQNSNGVYENYLHYFKTLLFMEQKDEKELSTIK